MENLQYESQHDWKYGQDKSLRILTPSIEWRVDFYTHAHSHKFFSEKKKQHSWVKHSITSEIFVLKALLVHVMGN